MTAGDATLHALAAEVGRVLPRLELRLATAESCTGGLVAAAITDIPGSSGWFERGFVTYSNEAKVEMIGVPAELIAQYGAVSEPVARAMAEGAVGASRAQIALSITGIAGPGGGATHKPVGTVVFAWNVGGQTLAETEHFPGDRQAIRLQAAVHALRGTLRLLKRLTPASS